MAQNCSERVCPQSSVTGEVVFVGSFNMDPRSANLNSELIVICRDNPTLAATTALVAVVLAIVRVSLAPTLPFAITRISHSRGRTGNQRQTGNRCNQRARSEHIRTLRK